MNFETHKKILKLKYGNTLKYYTHLFGLWLKSLYHRPFRNVYTYGKENKISYCPEGLKIYIWGNGNVVEIDPTVTYFQGQISIGEAESPTDNCTVKIGANSSAAGIAISLREDNSSVTIGKDCMFSWNIALWCTDFHTIYSEETKECLNLGKTIEIGDHVWIGNGVYVLKNTAIADYSVVGAGTLVSKKFTEPHVIIAGTPSQIVKRGINWSRDTPSNYLKKNSLSFQRKSPVSSIPPMASKQQATR